MELFAADGHDAGGCERVTGKSGMRPQDAVQHTSGQDYLKCKRMNLSKHLGPTFKTDGSGYKNSDQVLPNIVRNIDCVVSPYDRIQALSVVRLPLRLVNPSGLSVQIEIMPMPTDGFD